MSSSTFSQFLAAKLKTLRMTDNKSYKKLIFLPHGRKMTLTLVYCCYIFCFWSMFADIKDKEICLKIWGFDWTYPKFRFNCVSVYILKQKRIRCRLYIQWNLSNLTHQWTRENIDWLVFNVKFSTISVISWCVFKIIFLHI